MHDAREQLARQRFLILTLIHFGCVGVAAAGAANIGGKLLPDYAPLLGQILMAVAVIAFFLLPNHMRRRWKEDDAA